MNTEKNTIASGCKGVDDANPLITQRFGADPYAMIYKDRVYIYMTADAFEYDTDKSIKENTYSEIHHINVISTNDMVNFTDHGSINAASRTGAAKWAKNSWAPAAAWKEIDGKDQFFLYFADGGGGIGVLQADSPTGTFRDPLGKGLVTRETPNCADVIWLFDPAVLMDDDGRAYLYFGGGVPDGKASAPGTARVVELGADMIHIVGEPQVIDVPYLFEDSGIHKAGGKYYYTYCTNWQVDAAGTEQYGFQNGEIACMVSDAPMGPFVYQETILRNPGSVFGLESNNHHCIFCFRDQWYVAYHTRVLEKVMGVEKGYRCTHIDTFVMQEDGLIGEIQQTLRGRRQIRYVDACQENPAVSFAVMAGMDTVPEDRSGQNDDGCGMVLAGIDSGGFIKVAGVDFAEESPKVFTAALRRAKNGTTDGAIHVRIDSLEGKLLASLPVKELADSQNFLECGTQLAAPVQGVHDLYLIFDGGGYEIKKWRFKGEEAYTMELIRNKEKVAEYRRRAQELVAQMTLEEKVLQTVHQSPAVERLGIKAYNWWNEALHGVARAGTATIFPQAIGMAAVFDEDLMEQVGDAVSTEARAKFAMQQESGDGDIYKGLTFWAPNVNIFRDPRWGRGHETFGEDPYLTGRLGVRYIMGLQGHNENYLKTAACAKHFAVHSGPEAVRHSFDARVNEQDLRETYLPAFQACVQEAGVETVMGAYNRTNGEPCCGSRHLLTDILRKEWGFDGHVTSDCWAIKDFHEYHGVTSNPVESVSLAMNNGCDLNCGSLFLYLEQAVKEGMVDEKRLDEAVVNLFTSRMKLGVFDKKEDNPYDNIPYTVVDSPGMRRLNEQVAERCVVLLKNENHILPLKKDKIRTIGVIGPNADNRRALVGNYEGTASRYVTVLEGIQDYVGDDVRVLYSEGCHLYKDRTSVLAQENDRASEVWGICQASDVIIAVMGLDASLEGEEGDTGNEYGSGDKPNLNLPGLQHDIIRLAKSSGKPVILVLLTGSAMAVTWEDENLDAIMQGWYPGAQGGAAIARLLFGDANPEGRLPITFYRTSEELPDFEDYSMKGRTYRYMKQKALYPFGYGLSYTDYTYRNVKLVSDDICGEKGVILQAEVQNTGKMDGTETVQVYVGLEREDVPNPQLKRIIKTALKSGETKEIEILLPKEAFMLYDEKGELVLYPGTYHIYIGGSQPDERSLELTKKTVSHFAISLS